MQHINIRIILGTGLIFQDTKERERKNLKLTILIQVIFFTDDIFKNFVLLTRITNQEWILAFTKQRFAYRRKSRTKFNVVDGDAFQFSPKHSSDLRLSRLNLYTGL